MNKSPTQRIKFLWSKLFVIHQVLKTLFSVLFFSCFFFRRRSHIEILVDGRLLDKWFVHWTVYLDLFTHIFRCKIFFVTLSDYSFLSESQMTHSCTFVNSWDCFLFLLFLVSPFSFPRHKAFYNIMIPMHTISSSPPLYYSFYALMVVG